LALRGHDILRSRRLLREADSETRRGLLASIRLAAASFRGQVKARKRASTPLREAGLGSVADPPVAVAAPASARPTRSAAAVSRVKTRKIVEAPWPPASETAASAPASPSPVSRRSSGLFVSSPVALYEGDVVMRGGVSPSVPLGLRSPSPAVIPALSPVCSSSPPPASPAFLPVSSFSPAAPVAPSASVGDAAAAPIAPTAAQWEQLMSLLRDQHAEQLAELRGIARSLRPCVSFFFVS
jgi:hypothetical protein